MLFPPGVPGVGGGVFTPRSLANLTFWLDASDLTTIYQDAARTTPVTADGQPVGGWADKSNSGNHAINAGGTVRPLYKTAIQNGKAGLLFDGSNDTLIAPCLAQAAQTVFIVAKRVAGSNDRVLWGYDAFAKVAFDATQNWYWYTNDGVVTSYIFGGPATTTSLITTTFVGASSMIGHLNGNSVVSLDPEANHHEAATSLILGADGGSNGNIYVFEMIRYDRALSDAERIRVERYLYRKWHLTLLTLNTPKSYEVFQRTGATGQVVVSGTIHQYAAQGQTIQARWDNGDWQTIASAVIGDFAGSMTAVAAGLQKTVDVQLSDASETAQATYVGIGDVFLLAGQSNSGGRGTNNQTYSHASLKAALFGNDYLFKELADPSDSATGQVDTVSTDVAAAGSLWPLLATLFMANQGVPVMFIPCSKATTKTATWQPGVDHQLRTTLYGSMIYRGLYVKAVKAVLWHLGEQDIIAGTVPATFNAELDTIANTIMADLGVKSMVCKIQDLSAYPPGYDESAINAAIGTAWADNANILAGPDFSNITPSTDGLHFVTDAELLEAATRWWAALNAAFYT